MSKHWKQELAELFKKTRDCSDKLLQESYIMEVKKLSKKVIDSEIAEDILELCDLLKEDTKKYNNQLN